MKKRQYIKVAAQKAENSEQLLIMILEVLLDVREMIDKQNEIIIRRRGSKT